MATQVAARPSTHPRYSAGYRLDQIVDHGQLLGVAQQLAAALQAAQWQQLHLADAFAGGCLRCGLAIDAGEHPGQACADWTRRKNLIDNAYGALMYAADAPKPAEPPAAAYGRDADVPAIPADAVCTQAAGCPAHPKVPGDHHEEAPRLLIVGPVDEPDAEVIADVRAAMAAARTSPAVILAGPTTEEPRC